MSAVLTTDEVPQEPDDVATTDRAEEAEDALPTGRARTLALVSLLLASAMELVDTTIVNVALPSIDRDFGATGTQLQWMIAGYPLAFAVALITGSRLGDAFGRRRLFLGGLVVFTVMSAACGLAPDAGSLVAFRALQGLGAAAMIPQVMSNIQVLYAPEERAKAMGAFTGLAGIAVVVGPILGSVLTELGSWRLIFLVNVPIGVGALLAALRFIPESRAPRRPRFDPVGVVALAAGLLGILYPLTLGREEGWPAWIFATMISGAALLTGFVVRQRRAERAGREPLVAVSLYAVRSFAGGSAFMLVMFTGMSAYFLAQTVYLQIGLGWSVLKAGLVGIPFAVTTSAMAGFGVVVLAPRIGRKVLQLGAGVLAAGALLLSVTVGNADPGTAWGWFVPGFVVAGAGFGLMVAPIGMLGLVEVPVDKAGSASGLFNTTTQLAGATGVAVLGTIFFQVVQDHAGVPSEMFGAGFQVVLWILAGLMVVAAVVARTMPTEAPQEAAAVH